MSTSAETLDWKVMKYCADCVEWCPISEFHNVFVCGAYQLEDSDHAESESCSVKKRLGCICLYEVSQKGQLRLIQSIDTPGVLDMKWCPLANSAEEPILAVANAKGEVLIFVLQRKHGDLNNLTLSLLESFKCAEKEGILSLSLDWAVIDLQLAVSDSNGDISILKMKNNCLEKVHQWNAHGHEAWVATFDNQNPNIVYSGGDDSRLVVYDIRQKFQVKCLTRDHNSGVTSLSCNENPNILASGSYDEFLRLWDKRQWKSPTDQINLGGGVWRIKWKPHVADKPQNYLLAACMHAGFKLVDCTAAWNGGSLSENFTYTDHGSLAYGCDWCHSEVFCNTLTSVLENCTTKGLVATCSFYDHKLSLWLLK